MNNNNVNFQVSLNKIQFQRQINKSKFVVKNTSLKTSSYEIVAADSDHFRLGSQRTFHLAPGMSKTCIIQHVKIQNCSNKCKHSLRITNSEKNSFFIQLICPIQQKKVRKFLKFKPLELGEFNFNIQQKFKISLQNISQNNLKLCYKTYKKNHSQKKEQQKKSLFKNTSSFLETNKRTEVQDGFKIQFQEQNSIVLQNKQTFMCGKIHFTKGFNFQILIAIEIISEQEPDKIYYEFIPITGQSLMKYQHIKNEEGKILENLNLQILNGQTLTGEFLIQNNYRKKCQFKLFPQFNTSNPNQFSLKWAESQIYFSQETGQLKPFQSKKIKYQIKTNPSEDDLRFVEKYSKIHYQDQIAYSKLKFGKYFKKITQISVRAIFLESQEQKSFTLRMKLTIVNPALRIIPKSTSSKQIFQIQNDSQINIPYEIPYHSLYKTHNSKGVIKQMQKIVVQWKNIQNFNQRAKSANKLAKTTFSLVHGKCDIILNIPKSHIVLYQFLQRQNIRPVTSTIRKQLGLQSKSQSLLKRPLSSICNQMNSKKLKIIQSEDFLEKIPKYSVIQTLPNNQLQLLIITTDTRGNIFTNTWTKPFSVFFNDKGYLILQPQKPCLISYQLKITHYILNDQQFSIPNINNNGSSSNVKLSFQKSVSTFNKVQSLRQNYVISSREINFNFLPNQKEFQVINYLSITNTGKQIIKVFLLTVDDEYFVSGEQENKVIIHPEQNVLFKLKFVPNASSRKEKIVRQLQFSINGKNETITCTGQLLFIEADFKPKQISFTNSHYGQLEVIQNLLIYNSGLTKFQYQIVCPEQISVNPTQRCGSVNGKSNISVDLKFKPLVFLQNWSDYIKVYIKGSHIMHIPVKINTLKPNVQILQNNINFGEGIIGDVVFAKITLSNNNNAECRINLNLFNTKIQFNENDSQQMSVNIEANTQKQISLKTTILELGNQNFQISQSIASIYGFGAIKSPKSFEYKGKQNLIRITPAKMEYDLNIEQLQEIFKIDILNLAEDQIKLRTQVNPKQKYSDFFLLSVQPHIRSSIRPREKCQMSISSLIMDLQKAKGQKRCYILNLFIDDDPEPYTKITFNISIPMPKLIISPSEIYFPIANINQWQHTSFQVINKGFKQIHYKIKRPSNISFQLQYLCKSTTTLYQNQNNPNKLTKLNNKAEIRLSFRSKNQISFQNFVDIEDDLGNIYHVKVYGLTSTSPLLMKDCQTSLPISAKSIPSMISSSTLNAQSSQFNSQTMENFLEDQTIQFQQAKFFNFWFSTFIPQLKREKSFNNYLQIPQNLISFLKHFNINLQIQLQKKQKLTLDKILYQLRKLDIPLDVIRPQFLVKGSIIQWNKFIYIFLGKCFVSQDCLKWISKTLNMNIQSYDTAFKDHKKIMNDLLNHVFQNVFKTRIKQFERMIQKFDPYLEFLYKIQNKKHLIICLNILYYKLSKSTSQKIVTQKFSHKINILFDQVYERTNHFIVSKDVLDITQNDGGNSPHTNMPGTCYYFSLDQVHLSAKIGISLKEPTQIAILNNTLFEPYHFIHYDLQQIQPKIHNVTIECEDKFSQQWVLEYIAPIDSQYKIDFSGDMQFRMKHNISGLVKAGRKLNISVIYSPNNLNGHQATLTILNKHYSQVYQIKGKPLYSQMIQLQKHLKIYQGKQHTQNIQFLWDLNQTILSERKKQKDKQKQIIPNLYLTQYNGKRQELLSSSVSVFKHAKKQFVIKLKFDFLFQKIFKKLELLYQITNQDRTQSKIIKIIIKVVPKPINIQAEITCKLQASVVQKIPIQNTTNEKQLVTIQVIRNKDKIQSYEKIQSYFNSVQPSLDTERVRSQASSKSIDNQFKINKTGKIFLNPKELQHVNLTYRPQSLYESNFHLKITYQESQTVINYFFKGIPQFPKSHNEQISITCRAQQLATHKILLKSIVRQQNVFQVQTNIKEISGLDKVTLKNGQSKHYVFNVYCFHPGQIRGQIIFKTNQIALVYPLLITVQKNPELVKKLSISSKIRNAACLQIQLNNKSDMDIQYDVICNHEFLTFPVKFKIGGLSKSQLVVQYLPIKQGKQFTELKLYNKDMKQLIYQIEMTCQSHEQIIQSEMLQLQKPHKFYINIKNPTNKACFVIRPQLPEQLKINPKTEFPISLLPKQTSKIQLTLHQYKLLNSYQKIIEIQTNCIGVYRFLCKFDFQSEKTMDPIYVHYQANQDYNGVSFPFSAAFANQFNEKLSAEISFQGDEKKMLKLISSQKLKIQPYEKIQIKAKILLTLAISQNMKSMMSIVSSQQINQPLKLVLTIIKNKLKYTFAYPIKLIKVYTSPQKITLISNAHEVKRVPIKLFLIKQVIRWTIQCMDKQSVKDSFNFTSVSPHQNFLEVIMNKPFKYQGFISFYNAKGQAEKVSLKIDIGESKYQPIVMYANMGNKSIIQLHLKNGKGKFKTSMIPNKFKQFSIQPQNGQFQMNQNHESIAKIRFGFEPKQYSGIKKVKCEIIGERSSYYFLLIGKLGQKQNDRQKQRNKSIDLDEYKNSGKSTRIKRA